MKNRLVLSSGLILAVLLNGCQSIQYYSQAIGGQVDIWSRQRDIEAVLADSTIDPALKTRLATALRARRFASEYLDLPENGSYSRYADIERSFVVWSVVATPRYSVEPISSCFPVVGCVSYRGYYQQADAQTYADNQRDAGLDVYIGGVSAYSTLGWFDDPLLNTMLGDSDADIAGLIFHELAHQKVFVKDDTRFNESFATAVEEIGLHAWAELADTHKGVDAYMADQRQRADIIALLLDSREKLRLAYAQNAGASEQTLMLVKQAQFDRLRQRYAVLKREGGGTSGFDRFINSELNNASLAIFGEYHGWAGAFKQLFEQVDGDWQAFYSQVEALAALPRGTRDQTLDVLSR